MSQGLAPLNPNAVSGNNMYYQQQNNNQYQQQQQGSFSMSSSGVVNTLSPIMPCGGNSNSNNSNSNANDASITSTTSTSKTDSSFISNGGTRHTQQVRRRKYTHNPYATSSNASSRASSTCSTDNSAPSTPMSGSFAPHSNVMESAASNANTISATAAAGGYMDNSNNGMMMMNNNNSNNFMTQQQQQHPHGNRRHSNNNMNMNMNNNNNGMNMNTMMNMMNMMMNNNTMNNNNSNMNNNNQNMTGNDVLMFPGGSVHSLKSTTEQFEAMRGNLVSNSCSQKGRHVVVAMIRLQQAEFNDIIFDELSAGWGTLISDMNGCHVARCFVESYPSDKIQKLAELLSRDVVLHMCSASQYSRRVLQSMFENHASKPHLQAIVDHVASGAVALATTQQGCISVMRVLEFSKADQREQLMSVLSPHLAALAADPYGNYVLQTITQSLGSNELVCSTLEKSFEGSWVALSCNKFASNVMEKVIRISAETPSSTVRKTIIDELVCNNSHLSIIIVDGYGNFVLQAIIDSCNNMNEFKKIGDRVRPLLASSPYGHKIEGKLKSKRFNNSNSNSRASSQEGGASQQQQEGSY